MSRQPTTARTPTFRVTCQDLRVCACSRHVEARKTDDNFVEPGLRGVCVGGTNPEQMTGRRVGPQMTEMRRTTPPIQKVVVVNGNREVFGTLESVLESGRYDMVFVEPGNRAYSQVKAVQPDLVVLCTRIERLEGLQVLTMLKLDPETRDIPVLTYTMEYDEQGLDATFSQLIDGDRSSRYSPARRMN